MESFCAPYVRGNDNLLEAITRMATIKSSALVVNNMGVHHLFASKTVFENYSKSGLDTCSALPVSEGYNIGDLSNISIDPATFFAGKSSNYYLSTLFEDVLSGLGLTYGFLYPEKEFPLPQLVMVLTLHESDKYDNFVGTNTICVCDSPNRHLIYDGNKDGKDCDFDPPHKYKCTSSM